MKSFYFIKPSFNNWVAEYRATYPNIAQYKSIRSLREVWRNIPCLIA